MTDTFKLTERFTATVAQVGFVPSKAVSCRMTDMEKLNRAFYNAYETKDISFDELMTLAGDLYNTQEVQGLAAYEQHLDINRLQHITAVACTSVRLCKRFGLDSRSAARGAVMHDLFYYDWRDGKTGRWHKMHGYKHPRYSLLNARELCPDITAKEENIILRHMWPLTVLPPKYAEGLVVSLADKYCATLELLFSLGKISVPPKNEV